MFYTHYIHKHYSESQKPNLRTQHMVLLKFKFDILIIKNLGD